MEVEKRKRKDDGESNGKRGKSREGDHGVKEEVVPPDEEVEEFFAILKRMQVAVKYFQSRNGGGDAAATAWSPSFKPEDFEGVKKDGNSSEETQNYTNAGLDLNFDPVSDGSDSTA